MKEPKPTDSPNIFPEIQAGIDALPDDLFDHDFAYGQHYEPQQMFNTAMRQIFDIDSISAEGMFIGTDPEAQRAVQQGLLNSMQRVATGEALSSGEFIPRGIVHPVGEYFEHPDGEIVKAMERRTSRLKEAFMLDGLRECEFRARKRSFGAEFSVDNHPEYRWARLVVNEYGIPGSIQYEFFSEKPDSEVEHTKPAARFWATFAYKKPVPDSYRTEEPYLAGMRFTTDDEDAPNYKRHEFDVSDETMELLGGATKRMVTDRMAQIFSEDIDKLEEFRASKYGEAWRAIQTIDDPVELRNVLDDLGVDSGDDPHRFRTKNPDEDLFS